MAPPSMPLTPNTPEYVSVKTPDGAQQSHEAKSGVSPWSTRYRFLGNAAQFLIVASLLLYTFFQLAYFTNIYNTGLKLKIQKVWGVDPNVKGSGRSEMTRPTYFFFFAVLPVLASVLLIEFVRHFNVRRISSHYVLQFAMVMRRKPSMFGKVSYWSFGEWIFFAGFLIGGNIFVFYNYLTPRLDRLKTAAAKKRGSVKFEATLEAIALSLGWTCIYNMAFLFLPATRNCAWMEIFNISYANGIKYHRWLGVITVLTALFHCAGYYWSWLRKGEWKAEALPCFNCNIADHDGYHKWFNFFGELALLCFLLIGVTSIPFVRRKLYNIFYYVHQLFTLGVIFAVMHYGPILWWVLPTFLIYCFSRAVSSSNAFTPVEIKELTAISDDLVKVVITRSPHRDGHYKVGQFLYLNEPSVSKLQWHAFTIASSPRTNATTVTVLLKSLGDWTEELVTYANECKDKNVLPTVYVDGYYGASLEMYDEYSTLCLVGGGIGATPMFAILEDLVTKLSHFETLKQRVVFIFSFRELALLEEIHPVLLRLKELDPQEKYFKLHFYLTRLPTEDVLSQPIDNERLEGKHIQPTHYAAGKATPMAFYEPLRSRTYKALTFATIFFICVVMVVFLEYGGGKIEKKNDQFWPLQQFVEAAMIFVAGAVVYLYVLAERASKRRAALSTDSKEFELQGFQAAATPSMSSFVPVSDVHTYNDLLSHYNVVIGERPNTKELMAETFEFHSSDSVLTYGKPVVGVFVSGPEAMKRAVEYAAADIGTQHFDIHEEEFEL